MTNSAKIEKDKVIIQGNPSGFHFHMVEFHRLRYLNYKAVNIVSRIFLSLFTDFYPTLKR